jgi:hypothetical protein
VVGTDARYLSPCVQDDHRRLIAKEKVEFARATRKRQLVEADVKALTERLVAADELLAERRSDLVAERDKREAEQLRAEALEVKLAAAEERAAGLSCTLGGKVAAAEMAEVQIAQLIRERDEERAPSAGIHQLRDEERQAAEERATAGIKSLHGGLIRCINSLHRTAIVIRESETATESNAAELKPGPGPGPEIEPEFGSAAESEDKSCSVQAQPNMPDFLTQLGLQEYHLR